MNVFVCLTNRKRSWHKHEFAEVFFSAQNSLFQSERFYFRFSRLLSPLSSFWSTLRFNLLSSDSLRPYASSPSPLHPFTPRPAPLLLLLLSCSQQVRSWVCGKGRGTPAQPDGVYEHPFGVLMADIGLISCIHMTARGFQSSSSSFLMQNISGWWRSNAAGLWHRLISSSTVKSPAQEKDSPKRLFFPSCWKWSSCHSRRILFLRAAGWSASLPWLVEAKVLLRRKGCAAERTPFISIHLSSECLSGSAPWRRRGEQVKPETIHHPTGRPRLHLTLTFQERPPPSEWRETGSFFMKSRTLFTEKTASNELSDLLNLSPSNTLKKEPQMTSSEENSFLLVLSWSTALNEWQQTEWLRQTTDWKSFRSLNFSIRASQTLLFCSFL